MSESESTGIITVFIFVITYFFVCVFFYFIENSGAFYTAFPVLMNDAASTIRMV